MPKSPKFTSKSSSPRLRKHIERVGKTEYEIEEIREAFYLYDTHGNGKIDINSLKSDM